MQTLPEIIICDGFNAFVFDVSENGKYLTLSGFNSTIKKLKKGTLLLISQDGKNGSLYKIIENDNTYNNKSQYFLKCEHSKITIIYKIRQWINQKFCKHDYKMAFGYHPYEEHFMRCSKCGKEESF